MWGCHVFFPTNPLTVSFAMSPRQGTWTLPISVRYWRPSSSRWWRSGPVPYPIPGGPAACCSWATSSRFRRAIDGGMTYLKLALHLHLYRKLYQNLYLCLCLSTYLSMYLSICLSIDLSIYRSIDLLYLPIYLSTYLPIYLSAIYLAS